MDIILLVIQTVIALLLIGFVLLQRSDNDGFGMGSGGGSGLMSSRGQANFMTRATAILAFIFMALSLVLTIITTRDQAGSLIDEVETEQRLSVPLDGALSSTSANKDAQTQPAASADDEADATEESANADTESDAGSNPVIENVAPPIPVETPQAP